MCRDLADNISYSTMKNQIQILKIALTDIGHGEDPPRMDLNNTHTTTRESSPILELQSCQFLFLFINMKNLGKNIEEDCSNENNSQITLKSPTIGRTSRVFVIIAQSRIAFQQKW